MKFFANRPVGFWLAFAAAVFTLAGTAAYCINAGAQTNIFVAVVAVIAAACGIFSLWKPFLGGIGLAAAAVLQAVALFSMVFIRLEYIGWYLFGVLAGGEMFPFLIAAAACYLIAVLCSAVSCFLRTAHSR